MDEEGIELLYIVENGPCGARGELDGENEKFCRSGPADVIIGSCSRSKVSIWKGMPEWP